MVIREARRTKSRLEKHETLEQKDHDFVPSRIRAGVFTELCDHNVMI